MPASPSLRYSPTRGKPVVSHRRGLSMEDSFLSKEKEEKLELFSGLQEREKEEFLIQFPDDFDKTFSSKLKNLSDVKLVTSVQGENSELLNIDTEKHDYDWLITPPETPLFPSLDDEGPASGVSRGRPRTQPVSISRSSTVDKSCRSSRGSPSPNRRSHSPRSATSSTSQSKGKPSSSPSSSQRSVTPFRGPSSPKRTSPSAPRSSTPSSRRIGSSHGSSPIRATRGSPKMKVWQSNIPGFSSEAPPNLRTSLGDRPAYCRGSSPARNSRDPNYRRKSTSPASRQFQEGDSVVSPARVPVDLECDDDIDSPQLNDRMSSKKVVVSPGNRNPLKKTSKTFSTGSLAKRSFESPNRQTEYKKTPPNMFRPLLSSAPTSTLYGSKAYSAHHLLISTTPSNNDFDHIHSLPMDSEDIEDYHHYEKSVDMNSHVQALSLPMDAEVNADESQLQKNVYMDPVIETSNHDLCTLVQIHSLPVDSETNEGQSLDEEHVDAIPVIEASDHELNSLVRTHSLPIDSEVNEEYPHFETQSTVNPAVETSSHGLASPDTVALMSENPSESYSSDSNNLDELKSCARCGENYSSVDFIEEINLCINCYQKEAPKPAITCNSLDNSLSCKDIVQDDVIVQIEYEASTCENEEVSSNRNGSISSPSHVSSSDLQQASLLNLQPAKNEGFSMLNGANTNKRLFLNRSFSSTITYDDLVYAREGMRSVRSSIGTSASSSADFTTRSMHRQISARTTDFETQTRPSSSSSKHKAQMEDIYIPLEDADEASSSEANTPCDNAEAGSCSDSIVKRVTKESCIEHERGRCDCVVEIEHRPLSDAAVESEVEKQYNEEESETVLFCKSLVNDLVYHAATLAVDKESSVLTENSRPALTFMDRSNVGKGKKFEAKSKPEPKTHLSNPKKMSFDDKVPIPDSENDENMNEAIVHKKTPQHVKTPKIESKCNCAIM